MELSLEYIITNIMILKKSRDLKTEISKRDLIKVINEIINEAYISDEEKQDIINDFDLDYELEFFLSECGLGYTFDGDLIKLDDSYIDELEEVNDKLEKEGNIDNVLYDTVDYVLYGNINAAGALGIVIRKDIYNYLKGLINRLKELYGKLANTENDAEKKKIINKLKLLHFEKELCFLNMHNTTDINEYYDLILYAEKMEDKINKYDMPFNIENHAISQRNINHNPFGRALFIGSTPDELLLARKINHEHDKSSTLNFSFLDRDFYLKYYFLLDEEINNIASPKLKQELNITKYNLMYVLDLIYNTNLFMGNINYDYKDGNYEHFKKEAYFFVEEVLSYKDDFYKIEQCEIIIYYNILKKLFVKTYYSLTYDNEIIDTIKKNELFDINKESSTLFKDMLVDNKTKVREP